MHSSSPLRRFLYIGIVCAAAVVGYHMMTLWHAYKSENGDIDKNIAEHASAYTPSSEAGAYLVAQRAEHDSDWPTTHSALSYLENSGELPTAQNARLFLAAIATGDWDTARKIKKNHPEAIASSAAIVPMLAAILDWSDSKDNAVRDIQRIGYNPISQPLLPFAQGWMTRETPRLGVLEAALDIGFSTINMARFYEATKQYGKADALMIKLQEADLSLRLQTWSLAYFERRGLQDHIARASEKLNLKRSLLPETSWKAEELRVRQDADGHLKSDKRALALTLVDATSFLEAYNASAIALLYAQTALKLAPDLADGPIILGSIYEVQENWQAAYESYAKISPSAPSYVQAQLRAAGTLIELQKSDDALKIYNALVKKYPKNPEVFFQRGEFYRSALKDFDNAIADYNVTEKLLGKNIPDSFWTLYLARGLSYESLNKKASALKDYETALRLQPNNAEALNTLAYSWADANINLDKAQDMLEQALRLQPDAPHIIDSLGWVLFRKGEFEKAVILLERAVQMMPYDPTVNEHLGDAYAGAGRMREAKFMWQRALDNADETTKIDVLRKKLNQ